MLSLGSRLLVSREACRRLASPTWLAPRSSSPSLLHRFATSAKGRAGGAKGAGAGHRAGKKAMFRSKPASGGGRAGSGGAGKEMAGEETSGVIFLHDKRQQFFGFGVMAVIQLLFLTITGNVFYTLARLKREMEEKERKKEELRLLCLERDQTPAVIQRAAELRKELQGDDAGVLGMWELVTSFTKVELISTFLPIAFGLAIFFIIRGYGHRFINRIEVISAGKEVKLGTYNLFGRHHSQTVAIKDLSCNFDKNVGSEQWLGFKGPSMKWLNYLVDQKGGQVRDRPQLLSVLSGQQQGGGSSRAVAAQVQELLRKE